MYRLLILACILGVVAVLFRYTLRALVKQRMQHKGEQLRAIGVEFDEWLAKAQVQESDLSDKQRRTEVIERMLIAADDLLKQHRQS